MRPDQFYCFSARPVVLSAPIPGDTGICDLHKSIKARYDRKGVDIPFPYRMVVYTKAARDMEEIHGF